ncbi:SagB/ThcOx family dehydrogenase [Prosthecochloris sp.]|uniref:SagB/ThcOx family dehydrogenase n=1 Tax=Prosthecochloris sp. TaxID=290513 RepID=UPI0025F548AA|nr:SagB/ThcOx family dehydrogenase [Prosthecochloris sp.]
MDSGNKPSKKLEQYRYFLKDSIRQTIDFTRTAQSRRLPAPPLQKPCPEDAVRIDLPNGQRSLKKCCSMTVGDAIAGRESMRFYTDESLDLDELSALLWATQGIRHVLSEECALRTVPSAGARHSFETYVAASNVEELPAGLYRYLPLDHQLLQLFLDEKIGDKASWACMAQRFVAGAALTFFWTTIPARMEWRYDLAAHKVIALDAGHVCQNLYLACTALGAGTCAIAAYDQAECDRLLGVDGEEEFTVYIAPVGKV